MKTRRLALAMAALSLLSAGPALAAADLVPVTTGVSEGSFGVRNVGDSPSAPGHLTVVCEAIAGPSHCPAAGGMAAYENPAFPNAATISVPGLEPDETYHHELAFWPGLNFQPGTYAFTLTADAGNDDVEDDELNNAEQADKVVLPAVGVGGDDGRVGSFATKQAPSVVPGEKAVLALPKIAKAAQRTTAPVATALVAGLPDLIATPLGFSLAGGVHAWGSTVVVDDPGHVERFQHGPKRNLCLLKQAAYRAFNASDYAAGDFVNSVYSGKKKVHFDSLALGARESSEWRIFRLPLKEGLNRIRVRIDDLRQVSESDEDNVYTLRANVLLDCNGDGKIAGRPSGLKAAGAKAAKAMAPVRAIRTAPAAEATARPAIGLKMHRPERRN